MAKRTMKTAPVASDRTLRRFFVVPMLGRIHQLHKYSVANGDIELTRNAYLIMRIVLGGTFTAACLLLGVLLMSYFVAGNTYVAVRIAIAIGVLVYLGLISLFIRRRHLSLAGWMLVGFYIGLASLVMATWGMNVSSGLLTLGFTIVLAGIILGARSIITVTSIILTLLIALHLTSSAGIITPDPSDLSKTPNLIDLATYMVVFGIFALVSWLSGRRMEQALKQALIAEAALQEEKDMLAVRLEEQTKQLKAVQLEEMRQLYRFAELGQLSTIVMHELANHLTVLTLDIDDLEQRHNRSTAITNAKESIGYLDKMVSQVRRQLQVTDAPEVFDIRPVVDETITNLRAKAAATDVSLNLTVPKKNSDLVITGDPLRLSQIITIVVTNAIEAYTDAAQSSSTVTITITSTTSAVIVTITDHGSGISHAIRTELFQPFHSSKKSGMGIGLFVVKEMMETHFKGTIKLDPRIDQTSFTLTFPRTVKQTRS
jgi:signal transduction histidine kinase